MAQKKTQYEKILVVPQPKSGLAARWVVAKTYLCDMAKANACQTRAQWYGYEDIGPRVYALYRCAKHGIFRVRL